MESSKGNPRELSPVRESSEMARARTTGTGDSHLAIKNYYKEKSRESSERTGVQPAQTSDSYLDIKNYYKEKGVELSKESWLYKKIYETDFFAKTPEDKQRYELHMLKNMATARKVEVYEKMKEFIDKKVEVYEKMKEFIDKKVEEKFKTPEAYIHSCKAYFAKFYHLVFKGDSFPTVAGLGAIYFQSICEREDLLTHIPQFEKHFFGYE